ncbi:hypothetical protein R5W23_002412 [Gemmata sp. JC673]|uniref:Zf-HC2 domain-containing protein n=1 Tax=Gemmata algarum TaxID=2975278 RepID=A0ABU5F172_9BACT|nr:hypothetical protein [Gemmata algarum]MDY3561151.1 hypothetical protein [Gemmata algarum]
MICRQAAEAISRALDEPLPAPERLDLWVHTLFCGPCRRFRRQLTRLHAECAAAASEEVPADTPGLSDAARARIAAALEQPPPAG